MQGQSAKEWHKRFGHGPVVRFEAGQGGLTKAVICTKRATGEIYMHGAQVTAYQPKGHEPVLFMSGRSWFEAGKPIRGGVPVCFPWFANQTQVQNPPMHGFARLMEWRVASAAVLDGEAVSLTLELEASQATRKIWPYDFAARYVVTVGEGLVMRLEVENTDGKPVEFTEALHTYLAVGDVRKVTVRGLEGTAYLDKAPAGETPGPAPSRRRQGTQAIRIDRETDRIYVHTTATCVVEDPVLRRRLVVSKAGSRTTVVWNPWVQEAKRMPDFGDEEWSGMLCIETANAAENVVRLAPGQRQAMEAEVRVEALT